MGTCQNFFSFTIQGIETRFLEACSFLYYTGFLPVSIFRFLAYCISRITHPQHSVQWALDRFTKNFFWKFKKWIVNSMEDYQTKHVRIFFWSQMSLLHKVLDPPSYTRDLQRAKFWKSILGHNFWMECPMDLNSTPLTYIFNALFRDTPLAHLLLRHVCHVCHVCHVTCVTYVTCQMLRKVGKWDIPEKSIKNIAQRRWP